VTTLVSLIFITMIPIDCKITIFSLYLFASFLINYFLASAQILICVNSLASTLCVHPFSAHYTALQSVNSMKSISTIKPAITENTECLTVKVPPIYRLKVAVSPDHGVPLWFISLWTLWATFQAKNNVRSTPTSNAPTLVSNQSHNARTTNPHLRGSGKRNR